MTGFYCSLLTIRTCIELSILYFKGCSQISFKCISVLEYFSIISNSVDPDEMHYVDLILSLPCLPKYLAPRL